MPEFFKSKAGMLLAGIHLIAVFSSLLYLHLIDGRAELPFLISLVLSCPWYLLLFYLVIPLGLGQAVGKLTSQDFIMIAIVSTAIGALINAFFLYLLGFLLAKMFYYLLSKKDS